MRQRRNSNWHTKFNKAGIPPGGIASRSDCDGPERLNHLQSLINMPKISNSILRFIINNYKLNIVTIIDNAINCINTNVDKQQNKMKATTIQ